MKALKIIIIVIVIIIAIPLILGLFAKKDYLVEREITINKPKQEVFNYVKLLRNQEQYNKWMMADPNAVKQYNGTDGTPGYEMTWDSKDAHVGKGDVHIAKITEGERVDIANHFVKPFEGRATSYMTTDAVSESQTKVKWGFQGHTPYPMNAMMLFVNIDKTMGSDLQASLENLKRILEKQ